MAKPPLFARNRFEVGGAGNLGFPTVRHYSLGPVVVGPILLLQRAERIRYVYEQ